MVDFINTFLNIYTTYVFATDCNAYFDVLTVIKARYDCRESIVKEMLLKGPSVVLISLWCGNTQVLVIIVVLTVSSSFAVKTYAQNIYAMGHIFTLATNRHNTFRQVLRHIISSFLRHIYVEITERSHTVSLTSFLQEQRSILTFLPKYP